ncbi:hypothetical protein [Rhizobium sp. GR12]|uniref:hypothetical protein n=1 Tax=Rhizobium sp. GR12 TaxID=3053925 RepID=UPI002FBEDF52
MAKVVISGNTFSGGANGITTIGPVDIDASDNTFTNVSKPFNIADGSTGRIVNNKVLDDPKLRFPHRKAEDTTSSGWRALIAPPLPCYCSVCQTIFPSRNYVFAGPYFFCWGNTEECPSCGNEKAELSRGVFDLSLDTIKVLRAPEITRVMIRQLAEIGSKAAFGKISIEEAAQEAAAIHPTFRDVIVKWGTYAWAGCGILFFLAGGVDATWSLYDRLSDKAPAIQRALEASLDAMTAQFNGEQNTAADGKNVDRPKRGSRLPSQK